MRFIARARNRGQHTPGTMNKLEQEYAQYLERQARTGAIVSWRYEAIKLKLAANTFLTPDFFVVNNVGEIEFHETKGYMQEDANIKIKVAASMYPFRFVVIYKQTKKGGGGFRFEEIG